MVLCLYIWLFVLFFFCGKLRCQLVAISWPHSSENRGMCLCFFPLFFFFFGIMTTIHFELDETKMFVIVGACIYTVIVINIFICMCVWFGKVCTSCNSIELCTHRFTRRKNNNNNVLYITVLPMTTPTAPRPLLK